MNSPTTAEELIALGAIVKTHGLRGEVRLRPFNPDSELFTAGRLVRLRRNGVVSERRIRSARRHQQMYLLTFDGIDVIEQAEPLIGSELCVLRSELPETGPDEIYHFELIGMRVVTVDGQDIGSIVEIMDGAGADICVVRGHGHEHLIPMVSQIVREIDREARRVRIDPIPGLLAED